MAVTLEGSPAKASSPWCGKPFRNRHETGSKSREFHGLTFKWHQPTALQTSCRDPRTEDREQRDLECQEGQALPKSILPLGC